MTNQDLRKFPRYKAEVPIRFGDNKTDGKMVDVSQEGALIVMENNGKKSVGSYIMFTAYVNGDRPAKAKNTPEITLSRTISKITKSAKDQNKKTTVKIAAKVARVTTYEGKNAMGLEFMDMDVDDLATWLSYLGDASTNQEVLPYGTSSVDNRKKREKSPGFTIRFPDTDYIKEFLPDEPTGSFFIPTNKTREKNKKVRVTLVHPSQEKFLQIESVVESMEAPDDTKSMPGGLLCSLANTSKDMLNKINNFLDEPFYSG